MSYAPSDIRTPARWEAGLSRCPPAVARPAPSRYSPAVFRGSGAENGEEEAAENRVDRLWRDRPDAVRRVQAKEATHRHRGRAGPRGPRQGHAKDGRAQGGRRRDPEGSAEAQAR